MLGGRNDTNWSLVGEMSLNHAPFLSMSVRDSFPTVGEQLVVAPGSGHYSLNTAFRPTKGGGIMRNKVAIVCSDT